MAYERLPALETNQPPKFKQHQLERPDPVSQTRHGKTRVVAVFPQEGRRNRPQGCLLPG